MQDATHKIHENFLGMLRIGLEMSADWIISNAAIYVLNYHNTLLTESRQYRIVSLLQKCFEGPCTGFNFPVFILHGVRVLFFASYAFVGLQKLAVPDPQLLSMVGWHLARGLEQSYLRYKHSQLVPGDQALVAPTEGPLVEYFEGVYAKVRNGLLSLRVLSCRGLSYFESVYRTVTDMLCSLAISCAMQWRRSLLRRSRCVTPCLPPQLCPSAGTQ